MHPLQKKAQTVLSEQAGSAELKLSDIGLLEFVVLKVFPHIIVWGCARDFKGTGGCILHNCQFRIQIYWQRNIKI